MDVPSEHSNSSSEHNAVPTEQMDLPVEYNDVPSVYIDIPSDDEIPPKASQVDCFRELHASNNDFLEESEIYGEIKTDSVHSTLTKPLSIVSTKESARNDNFYNGSPVSSTKSTPTKTGRQKKGKYKEYWCSHCGKHFNHKGNMQQHERTHTQERPFACTVCGMAFKKSSAFLEHRRRHKGIVDGKAPGNAKVHNCEMCNRSFLSKNSYNTHLRTHTDEKSLKCEQCEKQFKHRSSLWRHRLIHAGIKKYSCDLCDRKFYDASDMRKHFFAHVGHKNFQCLSCGERFVQSSLLKGHLKSHCSHRLQPHFNIELKKLEKQSEKNKTGAIQNDISFASGENSENDSIDSMDEEGILTIAKHFQIEGGITHATFDEIDQHTADALETDTCSFDTSITKYHKEKDNTLNKPKSCINRNDVTDTVKEGLTLNTISSEGKDIKESTINGHDDGYNKKTSDTKKEWGYETENHSVQNKSKNNETERGKKTDTVSLSTSKYHERKTDYDYGCVLTDNVDVSPEKIEINAMEIVNPLISLDKIGDLIANDFFMCRKVDKTESEVDCVSTKAEVVKTDQSKKSNICVDQNDITVIDDKCNADDTPKFIIKESTSKTCSSSTRSSLDDIQHAEGKYTKERGISDIKVVELDYSDSTVFEKEDVAEEQLNFSKMAKKALNQAKRSDTPTTTTYIDKMNTIVEKFQPIRIKAMQKKQSTELKDVEADGWQCETRQAIPQTTKDAAFIIISNVVTSGSLEINQEKPKETKPKNCATHRSTSFDETNDKLRRSIQLKLEMQNKSIVENDKGIIMDDSSNLNNYDRWQETNKEKTKPKQCSHCGKIFEDRLEFQKHVKGHWRGTQFECEDCKRKFSKWRDYSHHDCRKPPRYCSVCNRKFIDKKCLHAHMIKVNECKVCIAKFCSFSGLIKHMKVDHPLVRFNPKKKSKISVKIRMSDKVQHQNTPLKSEEGKPKNDSVKAVFNVTNSYTAQNNNNLGLTRTCEKEGDDVCKLETVAFEDEELPDIESDTDMHTEYRYCSPREIETRLFDEPENHELAEGSIEENMYMELGSNDNESSNLLQDRGVEAMDQTECTTTEEYSDNETFMHEDEDHVDVTNSSKESTNSINCSSLLIISNKLFQNQKKNSKKMSKPSHNLKNRFTKSVSIKSEGISDKILRNKKRINTKAVELSEKTVSSAMTSYKIDQKFHKARGGLFERHTHDDTPDTLTQTQYMSVRIGKRTGNHIASSVNKKTSKGRKVIPSSSDSDSESLDDNDKDESYEEEIIINSYLTNQTVYQETVSTKGTPKKRPAKPTKRKGVLSKRKKNKGLIKARRNDPFKVVKKKEIGETLTKGKRVMVNVNATVSDESSVSSSEDDSEGYEECTVEEVQEMVSGLK